VQNPFGPLLSIKQTSSIMKYMERFERESTLLKKEERIMLKGIFLNGLKEEIQTELKLHAIGSLEELMDKALLLEEKNNALRKAGLMGTKKKGGERPLTRQTKGFTRWEKGGSKKGSTIRVTENDSTERKIVGGGRLSQTELHDRSKKGLCFKCGEMWGKDHMCKFKHYQFVLVEDLEGEESQGSEGEEENGGNLTTKILQISLKRKEGLTSNRSFKVMGSIGGTKVLVLVDCGASANFISRTLVQHLNLEVNDIKEFEVEVGTRDKVVNRGI